MKITISAEAGVRCVGFLRKHLKAASRSFSSLDELHVVLVGNRRMSDLHWKFMRVRGSTDVLTFPIDVDGRGRVRSGEVYVCVPEARRKAAELRIDLKLEVLLYGLHGMLHLLGYDDRTNRGYREMHAMEDRILRRLGLPAVFAKMT